MAGIVTFIAWVTFNVAFVIPTTIFLFYTLFSMYPLLASVEDLDAPIFQPLQLNGPQLNIDEDDVERDDNDVSKDVLESRIPRATTSSIRSTTRLLYSRPGRLFSLLRGAAPLLAWNAARLLLQSATYKLSAIPALLINVLAPLVLVQVHILWVHTVLSTNTTTARQLFWRRVVPFRTALGAVALPMGLELAAEGVTLMVVGWAYRAMGMKWEDFFPVLGTAGKATKLWVLIIVLVAVLVLPARAVLVRVEASLLAHGEETLVQLDPSLEAAAATTTTTAATKGARGYVTVVEAWSSFTRTARLNLALLYVRIFFIIFVAVVGIGFVDFAWWFTMAMDSWRF